MSNIYVPPIGTKGLYVLKAPFDKLVAPGEAYACMSIRTIGDYLANNEWVYETVYKPNLISKEDYLRNSNLDIPIVGLQNGPGQWIYLPATYILSCPTVEGIPYVQKTIVLDIQPLPVDFDYGTIIRDLENIISSGYGVNASGRAINSSKIINISKVEHEQALIRRASRVNWRGNININNQRTIEENNELRKKIKELEDFIKTKI